MIRPLAVALVAISALVARPALAWGPIGHRVTATIAQDNINGNTRAQIAMILGEEGLAEASTWPDEERSNPDPFWQETASPYHYVTLPEGRTVDMLEHPPEGDAVTALERFTATLRDPEASKQDKARALRFVVHIVSDLHMPLHAGNGTDRGGNDFIVSWFDEPTNLHWVWDEGMLRRQQLSFSEYADRLERHISPEQAVAWWDYDPADWIAESVALRDRIYPMTGTEEDVGMGTQESPAILSYHYQWEWVGTAEQRLAQSGIRLAAYLDHVFAQPSDR
ncbi:S1/P1 nuclease [Aurantiacibacter spongiae]|uniref:S1/P1 Nuclease n=1 Tax=Aurantiacibacter spongiae TaxID=2488860 RepID=A0A3N5DB43_9SPHN|nr:S1/P1 nuclease [Aurantiacibacter spongiae]RPF71948.1 S1/P1 Nuclease [Aurantiacibacter spongiae]